MLVDTTNMTEGQKAWVEKRRVVILQHDAWSSLVDVLLHRITMEFMSFVSFYKNLFIGRVQCKLLWHSLIFELFLCIFVLLF
jgi:hypothetical protein